MFSLKFGRITPLAMKKNVIVFAENGQKLLGGGAILDKVCKGGIKKSFRAGRFTGGAGELTRTVMGELNVIVGGVGKAKGMERKNWWKAGMGLGRQIDALGWREATIALGDVGTVEEQVAAGSALAEGVQMAMYRFEQYRSELKAHQRGKFEKLTVLVGGTAANRLNAGSRNIENLLDSVDVTRNAGNTPPNVANPQFLADEALKLEKLGVKVTVIDEKEMKKLGLNLILAVGGNAEAKDQPRLVIMEYNGGGKNAECTALVGKGICFDTGGYNIKVGGFMGGMKFDMSGAGAVLGTIRSLATRKSKVNVVGVMTCAMNMIAGQAFVPDSIYKSYKGVMVEIGNTDAEGRLVLADAVAYTIEKYQPARLIDLATLTGACMVALGGAYAGLFSNNQSLAKQLRDAGERTGERLWRLPLEKGYLNKSSVADISNDSMRYGGATAGAEFIWKFVDKTPWAHLDIAGVANVEKGVPGAHGELSGASGFGVRLLTSLLEDTFGGAPEVAKVAVVKTGKRGRPRKAA
ncbi:MAG TPA: leucyl aminopeptidase [Alphaproteobacteria bacterium]|nr:leucyl aminopeptidase [Alphaproteobacteria bacterium]